MEGFADALGLGQAAVVVVRQAEHGEAVVAQARGEGVGVQRALQAFGDTLDQVVGRGQADFAQQVLVVVGFDQQEGLLALAVGCANNGGLELGHEVLAIEQPGQRIALAQGVELLDHLRVHRLLAEHDLQAGLALVGGAGELHHRVEGTAVGALRLQVELARGRFALGNLFEHLLEGVGVVGADQVQQGEALDVLEAFEAEHFQVGVVGADVHALVHVGDRVARRGDECVAAAFGLAQGGLEVAQGAAGEQGGEFVADHGLHVLGAGAQRDVARAGGQGVHHRLFVQHRGGGDDGNVLARGGDAAHDSGQRQVLRIGRGQHQVHALGIEQARQVVLVLGTLRTHGDAAVAQVADELFGVL